MPGNQPTYPKNLAKPEVLLPLPALSSTLTSSAKKPADLMTSIKACNRTPQSHALLKSSLYSRWREIKMLLQNSLKTFKYNAKSACFCLIFIKI